MKKITLLSVFMIAACGTIINGSSQDMAFDSNIQGVEIYINGMKACKTPCAYPLDRGTSTIVVTAKKEGYEEQQQMIKSGFSPVAVLNLTMWPSWLTDVATGGMWRYNRDGIYIDMEKSTKKTAELINIKKDVATRRFALLNYGELKIEASRGVQGEYITSLAQLSGQNSEQLIKVINQTDGEVFLAHRLTGIE